MSDSLGNGLGEPTQAQIRLYERWAIGGVAASIIGEVQGDPRFPEKPGNLVLDDRSNSEAFRDLARRGTAEGSHLWVQLGHAGALTHAPIGSPIGPSELDLRELQCTAMAPEEIRTTSEVFASTAKLAQDVGFSGVQIHAAHGFLLSQFLSPLFNKRFDKYGGAISGRMRLLMETVEAVQAAVATDFTVSVKLNSSDQLDGGLSETDALQVIQALDRSGVDLIDISGGTYFPGAPSSSDRTTRGPYFLEFAREARKLTDIPLMTTGGFKRQLEAKEAIRSGAVDAVGLARALVLDPSLANTWASGGPDPAFPQFKSAPPGGITAWYTMRLTELGEDRESQTSMDLEDALRVYEARDAEKAKHWRNKFGVGYS